MPLAPNNIPISAIVVDDEALARSLIRKLVTSDPELMLVGEYDNGAEALEAIDLQSPQLVFLDVQMPVMDGVTLARKLSALERPPYVVFVTAFDKFATDAFDLCALDYLVKPVQKSRFAETLLRAKKAIRREEMVNLTERLLAFGRSRTEEMTETVADAELCVRSGNTLVHLVTGDIVWLEAASQYVHLHTDDRTYTVSETLSAYADRINDPAFFRVHRSAVVNAQAIIRVCKRRNGTHSLELRNGHQVSVARSRAAMVPDLLRAARQARPMSGDLRQ